MMNERRRQARITIGIMLIIIALYPFIKSAVITVLTLSQTRDFSWKLWFQYIGISFKPMVFKLNYCGLDTLLYEINHSLPLRHVSTFNYISLIIMYLPILCYITLFASGIGVLMRKERFRGVSVIALGIMLILSIANSIGLYIFDKRFYIDRILSIVFFGILIYYLIQLKAELSVGNK
jgi:hypothetical protein